MVLLCELPKVRFGAYAVFTFRAIPGRHHLTLAERHIREGDITAARVDEFALPTLAAGETVTALQADDFDPDIAGKRSMSYGRIDQLAIDHMLGAR